MNNIIYKNFIQIYKYISTLLFIILYRFIYIYLILNCSIFFIYGIYKYIGKLYWIATNGAYSIYRVERVKHKVT